MKQENQFKKFINNSYSKDDYLSVLAHFAEDGSFHVLKEEMKQLWDEFNYENISEEQRLRIQREVEAKLKFIQQKNRPTLVHRIYRAVNKVAAILLVPFIAASMILFYQLNNSQNSIDSFVEIYCPLGTRTKFNLPDGSAGWLNSGSTLKYPVQFKKTRNILLNGEAYFDVVENEKLPFEVTTQHFRVEVLGTKFNVASYNDGDHFAVTLESGEVKIYEKRSPHQLTMKPGYQFAFDKDKWDASLLKVNTQYYTSWKDGKMMFRNTPFSEVLTRLGRWYNADFICDDQRLLKLPYRATFQEESLDHVLELLTWTAPIRYEIAEPKILSDGTYEKQRIYIKRK